MKLMQFGLIVAAFSIVSAISLPAQTARWVPLFDGRSLTGWTPEQNARWSVIDGTLTAIAGGDGWLRSAQEYGDFALRIDFKNVPKGNSGVFLRATAASNPADPSNPAGSYELQINNEDPTWPTGSIENFIPRALALSPAANQWHHYDVECQGDHIVAVLDGVKVLDGRDMKFTRGFIGLQHHAGNSIAFRNIAIRSDISKGR